MTVRDICEKLSLTVVAGGGEGLLCEVKGCYIGDLLSWVMGRAPEGSAWITVMGNINAIAVAKLAGLSCIILCEGASLDAAAEAQAQARGVTILAGDEPAYVLASKLVRLGI